eukprot:CAMPEP_0204838142 /NCGR_PEP_ID=MMETSP1346-20131115/29985_1 /ASSEMBLY_ACC=CAM_ASM_000771 /TAXON_ID=215587 /ORGANISM="Aplanochytrium stocchinoi, Strain GSBS06" /LENGTH=403 /DNA_ID=CAMNT_0051974007 /DNA_START=58 /DNA_END=1269 /DNA_ORIENTATION=-
MVQRFGADYDNPISGKSIWPSGFHVAAPWVRVSHLVTKQNFVFNTPVKGCKTADNVTVTIDVALVLRIMGDEEKGEDPELVRTFVYKLTPRGLTQQIKDAQEEAVRGLARSVNHTAVYGLRSRETHDQTEIMGQSDVDKETQKQGGNVTEAMKLSLNQQFNKYGVEITDVAITNVRLPAPIAMQMQEKTTYASVIAEQKVKQKNELQLLGFREEKETALQKKKEEHLAEEANGIKVAAERRHELKTIEAETDKLLKEMKENERAAVLEIESKDELEIEKTKVETEKIRAELRARAAAEANALKTEASAYVTEKSAEILRLRADYSAKSEKINAEAEGKAAANLKGKRNFELDMQELETYNKLAQNKNVAISGKSSENFVANMLVAQNQQQILLNLDSKGMVKT